VWCRRGVFKNAQSSRRYFISRICSLEHYIHVTGFNPFDILQPPKYIDDQSGRCKCESGSDPAQQWLFHPPSSAFRSTNTKAPAPKARRERMGRCSHGIVRHDYRSDQKHVTNKRLACCARLWALAFTAPGFPQCCGEGYFGAGGESGRGDTSSGSVPLIRNVP
jgi:hypothetical protein